MGVDNALLMALSGDEASCSATEDLLSLVAFHFARVSKEPPDMRTGCKSASLPSNVP